MASSSIPRIESTAMLKCRSSNRTRREGVEILRHSTAHLLAYAVKDLFPESASHHRAVVENGFYYDFSFKRPFTPDDLDAIEKRMAELAKKDLPVTREVWPREQGGSILQSIGEHYKAEIVARYPRTKRSRCNREGDFIDLCRGPHVPSTGKLRVFKADEGRGAYWRGDSKNEMLQRIYGTAWAKKEAAGSLLAHDRGGGEARITGGWARNSIFSTFRRRPPAWVFWHPKAGRSGSRSSSNMRRVYRDHGYLEVRCPQILDRSLWEKSVIGKTTRS